MLSPASSQFLSNLADNNSREWFDAHRDQYEAAKKDWEGLVEEIRILMLPIVPELAAQTAKSLVFRIFRDVRFGHDKTPYKKNFSAYFCKDGRKSNAAGYYLHFEPEKCFIGAGVWMPEANVLKAIRQEIDYNLKAWEDLLFDKQVKKHFNKALEGEKLVRPPKGYDVDNPAIAYLKHKSFLLSTPLADSLFTDAKGAINVVEKFAAAQPLVDFLNWNVEAGK